ncbi:TetR/AcrR family transcriptional regulator [soil metagenome]
MSSASQSANGGSGPLPVGAHFDGDLRRALLDAAVESIAETGVDHLSLRAVARRTGVSHAAPAHHFGDKAGLLTVIATEGFDQFTDELSSVGSDAVDPLARLSRLGAAYVGFAQRRPVHFAVMFRPQMIRVDDPEFVRASDSAFAALDAQVRACHEAGWRREADPAALTIGAWALAHGLSVLGATGSLAKHDVDTSLDGILAIGGALLGPTSS